LGNLPSAEWENQDGACLLPKIRTELTTKSHVGKEAGEQLGNLAGNLQKKFSHLAMLTIL